MNSYFVISHSGVFITIGTDMKQDLEHLGQYIVSKLKKFRHKYDDTDVMKFVLNMIKSHTLVDYSESQPKIQFEYLYTIDFDSKYGDFIVEYKHKKSEFKFYLSDIPHEWSEEIEEWINKDEESGDESSESESENDEE